MRIAITILITMLLASAAHAQWVVTKEDDAFEGDLHIAGAFEGLGYGVGFRCRDGQAPDLVFMTPEDADAAALQGMAMLGPRILVVIDDDAKVGLGADLDVNAVTGRLMASSSDPNVASLLFRARSAKRRFAVALEVAGKLFHSKSFSAKGSGRALGSLAQSCNLQAPSPS
jgi:hypothetical protein